MRGPDYTLDLDRLRRVGFPEVVLAEGKSAAQIVEICRQLARAHDVLVTRLSPQDWEEVSSSPLPGRADYDPRTSPGVGGQVPVQNGLFTTFVLSAWIRELGFRATATPHARAEQLAAAAGLGTLDADGRLVTRELGPRVHVANVILTDLPLAPDG